MKDICQNNKWYHQTIKQRMSQIITVWWSEWEQHYRFMYLDIWSTVGVTVWEGLGSIAFFGEVCQWGWTCQAQVSVCLHFPGAGITITHHTPRVLYGSWGSNPDLSDCKANIYKSSHVSTPTPYSLPPPICKMKRGIHLWALSELMHFKCLV